MRFVLLILLVAEAHGASHSFDKIVEAAMDVLKEAKLGQTVRECSCDEDAECVKKMEGQVVECADGCWTVFSQITSNPQSLHTCITTKMPVIGNFIKCISNNLDSCVNTREGPQIPKVDLRRMFNVGEQRIISARAEMISNASLSGLRPIAESAMKFGGCVKKCFVDEKNSGGFCYEGKSCQPLITEENLRNSLKRCIGASSWKSHAADLCECATKAGVEGIDSVCSLLKAARSNG
ncbi:hypothetical protein V3C99_012701 [Haemonchus contortus]|uniref:Uncharacterized protein n=1 Tax=Haemonchus contortus TaxID=6289 RepID=A0A7I4Y391_HAECO|nr:24 kDa secreted protein [Haemonchus contortus]